MSGRIRITSGEDEGRVIEVGDELIVGRNRSGDGKIRDPEISRTHARVYVDPDGGLAIEDLGSTNGVYVGGIRITAPRLLSPGDTLRLGQTTLEVEASVPAAEPPPEDAEPESEPDEAPAAEPEPPATVAAAVPDPADEAPPPEDEEPEQPPPAAAAPPPPDAEPEPPPADAPPPFAAAPPPATAVGDGPRVGEAAAAAPPPQRVPRFLVAVLAGVFVLAGLGIAAVLIFTGDDENEQEDTPARSAQVVGPPALVRAATAAGCVAQDHPIEGRQHVTGKITYRTNPPSSGDHSVQAADDGAWEVSPPVPALVHSLERGRIVMWHRKGDDKGLKMLRKVGDEDGSKMLLVPNTTGMPYRVAASAWGHVLGCKQINDSTPDAVRAFRDAYRGKGPEFVP